MTLVSTPASLDELTAPLLRQGALASGSLSVSEFTADLTAGTLFSLEASGGLMLLKRRQGFFRACFLLLPQGEIPCPAPGVPVVLEIPRRRADAPRRQLTERLEQAGWSPLLSRVRLTRRPAPVEDASQDFSPLAADAARPLLESCFSPLTGCLPEKAELTLAAGESRLLGDARGVLHFTRRGNLTEIRHLAVAKNARGQGVGKGLVRAYLAREGNALSRVWTGADNAPALGVYHHFGYQEDGWVSQVLCYGKEDHTMKEQLISLLTQCCPGVDFANETALVDDGLLESLDIVTIVSEIMNEFDVVIGVDDLLPENFNSVDAMLALIQDKQA